MKPKALTYDLAMAIARDAGNRNRRREGRTKWNKDDVREAVRTFNRLWAEAGYEA